MTDLSSPCERCGSVDRYTSVGRCRPCWKAYVNARHADPTYRRPRSKRTPASEKPCPRCGAQERGKAGECRPCCRANGVARRGKPCVKCGQPKMGLTGACLPCANEYTRRTGALPEVRERRKEHKARYNAKPEVRQRLAARHRYWKYGVTETEQAAMLEAQKHCCDSCGDAFIQGNKWTEPHLDHDHETGEVGAFLCGWCNAAAGHLKDDPERVRKLANYLERRRPRFRDAK